MLSQSVSEIILSVVFRAMHWPTRSRATNILVRVRKSKFQAALTSSGLQQVPRSTCERVGISPVKRPSSPPTSLQSFGCYLCAERASAISCPDAFCTHLSPTTPSQIVRATYSPRASDDSLCSVFIRLFSFTLCSIIFSQSVLRHFAERVRIHGDFSGSLRTDPALRSSPCSSDDQSFFLVSTRRPTALHKFFPYPR